MHGGVGAAGGSFEHDTNVGFSCMSDDGFTYIHSISQYEIDGFSVVFWVDDMGCHSAHIVMVA